MRVRALVLGLITLVLLALPVAAIATVIGTDIYLLGSDQVVEEDLVLSAGTARIEGTINGDLTIAAGTLDLSGTVTGDLTVLSHRSVTVSGDVGGSVRGVARSIQISGTVADDVTVAAVTLNLAGDAGRDLAAWAWRLQVAGNVGRNLIGRFSSAVVAGSVGNDVDVSVSSLGVSGEVGGDLVYRSNRAADLERATVAGQVIDIPVRAPFMVTVVLQAAALFGLFGYLVGGIVLLWLFDATGARAVEAAASRAWSAIALGLAALVLLTLLIVALVVTLVGIPLALAAVLALVVGLGFGSVPAVAAAGMRLLKGRGGVFGGLVLGAAILALVAVFIPMLGALTYLVALVWGLGAWLLGGWKVRAERIGAAAATGLPG